MTNDAKNLKINTVVKTGSQCKDSRTRVTCDERTLPSDIASSCILNFLQMVDGVIRETIK